MRGTGAEQLIVVLRCLNEYGAITKALPTCVLRFTQNI